MINCIVAVDHHRGIGLNGQMPWPFLPGDMKWFKKVTSGHVVIMGSTTWKSLPISARPLPNRINVVLSKSVDYSLEGADHTFSNPETALAFCSNEYSDKEIFIIGGSEIYKEFINYIDKFLVTEIDASYNCDKFFNLDFVKKNFTNVVEHAIFTDPIKYTIKEYRK